MQLPRHAPPEGTYRIIDEQPDWKGSRPPWRPGAVAVLFWFGNLLGGPLGSLAGLLFVFNWARLGQPRKRWLTLLLVLLLAPLRFTIAIIAAFLGYTRSTVDFKFLDSIETLAVLVFAYWMYAQQEPLFAGHSRRKGKTAPLWPFFLLTLAACVIWQLFVSSIANHKHSP